MWLLHVLHINFGLKLLILCALFFPCLCCMSKLLLLYLEVVVKVVNSLLQGSRKRHFDGNIKGWDHFIVLKNKWMIWIDNKIERSNYFIWWLTYAFTISHSFSRKSWRGPLSECIIGFGSWDSFNFISCLVLERVWTFRFRSYII